MGVMKVDTGSYCQPLIQTSCQSTSYPNIQYNKPYTYSHSRRQYVVRTNIEEATAPSSQSFNKPHRQSQQRADNHMASCMGLLWYYYCVHVPEGWDVMDVSGVGNKLRRSIHSGEEVHSQGRPPDRQYKPQIFPSARISIHSPGFRLSDWESLSCSLKRALVQGSMRGSQQELIWGAIYSKGQGTGLFSPGERRVSREGAERARERWDSGLIASSKTH